MYGWPPWIYWIWGQSIRLMLIPIVVPVRIYEKIAGENGKRF